MDFAAEIEDLKAEVPLPPAPGELLQKVLGEVAVGFARFKPLLDEVARFVDLDPVRAGSVLRSIDDPEGWTQVLPGVVSRPIEPGPRWQRAVASIFKLRPGVVFPDHLHDGDEHVLVVQGGYRTDCGQEVLKGDWALGAAGTRESIQALDGPACICVVVQETR